jgi:hypothetical protein
MTWTINLLPPHCHRRDAAERAIRTFKEHFAAGLSSVEPTFPLHLWDRLLPQAEITLNLLRTSRLHPQLSPAAHFRGLVDYKKHILHCQVAKSLRMRNQQKVSLGHLAANMAILWAQPCIITDSKTCTSRPWLANA